jgi:hypothetical protein
MVLERKSSGLFPWSRLGKKVFQSRIRASRSIQQFQQGLGLAFRNHEKALVEQGLLRRKAGAIEDEIGQGFMAYVRRTPQYLLLFRGGPESQS